MQELTQSIIAILKQYGVKKASLFGSYARGDFDEKSDIDLLIEPPQNMGLSYIQLKLDLEEHLHKKVDIITYNSINKYLKKNILNNQATLL